MGSSALPLVRSEDELRLPACRGRCNNLRKHAGFAPNRLLILIRGCTPMTWSFRRAVLVLTAVAVLSSMAFLGHGYSEKRVLRRTAIVQPGAAPEDGDAQA